MKKMHFYTKFDLPKKVIREFDSHDNVDRLSYCDNTLMIQRFMEAGKNLKYQASQMLYKTEEDLKNAGDFVAPVYEQDPIVMQQEIDRFQANFDEQLALAAAAQKAAEEAAKKAAAKADDVSGSPDESEPQPTV